MVSDIFGRSLLDGLLELFKINSARIVLIALFDDLIDAFSVNLIHIRIAEE
jgi:hypothetical protein